ncbi:MAG: CHRD domain-containing protein [Alphaproteobacteria bacterium]|nr:MAG: CHRD domain-containing protein [Alphaproteobacteria bacterium]
MSGPAFFVGRRAEKPLASSRLSRNEWNRASFPRLLFPSRPRPRGATACVMKRGDFEMFRTRSSRLVLAALGGAAMIAGAAAPALAATDFHAVLNGDNVPGAADTDGWGRAKIAIHHERHQLCTDLEVRSIGSVTSVQIYRGGAGGQGEPVSRIERPDDNDSWDCKAIGDSLAQEIESNPSAFYVEVRTEEFPNGAIRGQIMPG